MNMLSSPISSAISTFAPSMVPMMRDPFMANFMLPVPEASVPAVLMCWDSSEPAMQDSSLRHTATSIAAICAGSRCQLTRCTC